VLAGLDVGHEGVVAEPGGLLVRGGAEVPPRITEKIISPNVSPKIVSTVFRRPVIGSGGPAGPLARASSPSTAGTSDLAGSFLTRRA
jgi:hypothetical protein